MRGMDRRPARLVDGRKVVVPISVYCVLRARSHHLSESLSPDNRWRRRDGGLARCIFPFFKGCLQLSIDHNLDMPLAMDGFLRLGLPRASALGRSIHTRSVFAHAMP